MYTPFMRAIDVDGLLIALDAGGNPDNGVDVRSGAAALKGSSLNFDQGIYDFGRQLYATVPELVQAMPGFKPVAHLYASLGMRIPVHAQSRIVTDTSGQALPGVQTVDYETDGTIRTEDTDQDADGVIDSHIGFEHDAFGRVTHTDYRVDFNLDHVIDQSYTYTAQFDAHGK